MKGAVVLNRSCGCVEWLAVTAVRAVWFFRALALPAPRPVSPELEHSKPVKLAHNVGDLTGNLLL